MQRRRAGIDRDRVLRLFARAALTGVALTGVALTGCAYEPGSFTYAASTFPGQRATIGCLDVAIDRRADLAIGPVLDYRFANRCNQLQTIDLTAVSVIGRGADGRELALAPYDPQGELHAVALDGRSAGGEALAYQADQTILEVCVDVAGLGGRASPATPQWRCFATKTSRAVVGHAP